MKKRSFSFKMLVVSLLLAIVVFIFLLCIQSEILNKKVQVQVVKAVVDMKENTVITRENVSDYFAVTKVSEDLKMIDSVETLDSLIDLVTTDAIGTNEMVKKDDFINKDSLLKNVKDKVEVSLDVDKSSQAVGGILREGDIISINVVNMDTIQNEPVLDYDVFVSKAFSSDGTRIDKDNALSSATIINVIIDKKDLQTFNEKINLGTIRMSKKN